MTTDHAPDLRIVASSSEPGTGATLDLIARARQSLAEARTLPDIRRVMEAASVAADAAQRAARLAAAQQAAAEVVEAANQAANDAAAVRIEAQAKAGELLRTMAERGDRDPGGRGPVESRPATQLNDLGVTKSESSLWQRVATVPAEVRNEYVEAANSARREVSTAGLLRHAQPRADADRLAIAADARRRMRAVFRGVVDLPRYRPEALVIAIDQPQRRELLRALDQLPAWIEDVRRELAIHHVREE